MEHAGGILVCTIYEGLSRPERRAPNQPISVTHSAISATTVNGRIVLSTGRPADAHVVNGSIAATLGNVEWEGSRVFGAVNGAVDLELPESCHASVRASTVLLLADDFGLPVHKNIVGSWFSGDIKWRRSVAGPGHRGRQPSPAAHSGAIVAGPWLFGALMQTG